MTRSNVIQCAHPNCDRPLTRGRMVCGRHWYALTDYLQEQSKKIIKKYGDTSDPAKAVRVEILHYLTSRLIGRHEILKCRGSTCEADIVWLDIPGGGKKMVAAASVGAQDKLFDHNRHHPHWPDCENKDEFQRR